MQLVYFFFKWLDLTSVQKKMWTFNFEKKKKKLCLKIYWFKMCDSCCSTESWKKYIASPSCHSPGNRPWLPLQCVTFFVSFSDRSERETRCRYYYATFLRKVLFTIYFPQSALTRRMGYLWKKIKIKSIYIYVYILMISGDMFSFKYLLAVFLFLQRY